MKVVEECAGVRKLDDSTSGFLVNLKHQDLAIGVRALPRLGQVILINGDTGVTITDRDVVLISFDSPAHLG